MVESNYTLNAFVEGEQFEAPFESREAALAAKEALKDAGYDAGVYEPVHE